MANPISNNYTNYATNKASKAKNGEYWYEDGSKNEVSMDSFLQLMIAQLKNQDFNNTMDDTQFITQMAQFSTLQAMSDLTAYTKQNYAVSMLGHDVAYRVTTGSQVGYAYGVVDAVSVNSNGEPVLYINGSEYSLKDIAQVYPKDEENIKGSLDDLADKIVDGIGGIIDRTSDEIEDAEDSEKTEDTDETNEIE